jgi:hypothetical protein
MAPAMQFSAQKDPHYGKKGAASIEAAPFLRNAAVPGLVPKRPESRTAGG